jgi:hypothetical protein
MATNKIDRHASALKIYEQDGQLCVQSHDADIAICVPGTWIRAKHANTESWEQPGL